MLHTFFLITNNEASTHEEFTALNWCCFAEFVWDHPMTLWWCDNPVMSGIAWLCHQKSWHDLTLQFLLAVVHSIRTVMQQQKKPDRLSVLACLTPTVIQSWRPRLSIPFRWHDLQSGLSCLWQQNPGFNWVQLTNTHHARQRVALRFAGAVVQPGSEKGVSAAICVRRAATKLDLRPIFASKHHPALSPHVGHKELQESRWRTPWHVPLSIPAPQFWTICRRPRADANSEVNLQPRGSLFDAI